MQRKHFIRVARERIISLGILSLAVFLFHKPVLVLTNRAVESVQRKLSAKFLLKEIIWENVDTASSLNVVTEEMLWAQSGIHLGDRILDMDFSKIEANLKKIPWIDTVQIQKKVPSTLLIRYNLFQPKYLALRKGKLWAITDEGRLIAPANPGMDFPVILSKAEDLSSEIEWIETLEREFVELAPEVQEVSRLPSKNSDRISHQVLMNLKFRDRIIKLSILTPHKPNIEGILRLKKVVAYLAEKNITPHVIDIRSVKKLVVNLRKRS